MFERLTWLQDRALLGDLVFRLEQTRNDRWELGDRCFAFYKNRELVDQFEAFWSATPGRPRHVLEIGIWDGGSTAFWFEHLQPERLVAIDLKDGEDSAYFRDYVAARNLGARLRTRWRTDQADRGALLEIVARDLKGRVDLVIDDGAHLLAPTRASFETLFPLLPPGGLYIIEDWAWEHWPEFQDPAHFWAGEEGLSSLVAELVAATGSSKTLIRRLAVHEGFIAVERGDEPLLKGFRLADHVVRRRHGGAPGETRDQLDARVLAFYLPQFHPIPENDRWWGPGYTEWSRVARARPQFEEHYQPHLPERLGFYDLRLPETMVRQADLARAHGIHGFCHYYYSFGSKRLLERPLEEMLRSGAPDFPFCVCWANENWTRRWDGSERRMLIEQRYGPDEDAALIEQLAPYFADRRYLRVRDAPVLVVYRPDAIPDPLGTTRRWRNAARDHGLPRLHLVAALTFGLSDPRPLGFDAGVEFPPHGENTTEAARPITGAATPFTGQVFDYEAVVKRRLALPETPFSCYRTAMVGWDNTPRLGRNGTVFHGASPEAYERWLRALIAAARRQPRDRLVFVNAWNEWSEGAHLEPDLRYGLAYLEATRRAVAS